MPKALAARITIMANPKYGCVIPGCSQTRINKHYVNHLLNDHTPAELRQRLKAQIQRATLGSLLRTEVKVDGQEHLVYICLACKKVLGRTALSVEHRENCPSKEEHKRIAKQLLLEDPTEVTKKEIAIQTEPVKAEPVKTPKALPDLTMIDLKDFIVDVMMDLEKDPGNYFLEKMISFQDNYPEAFNFVIKDWGEYADGVKCQMDDHREISVEKEVIEDKP